MRDPWIRLPLLGTLALLLLSCGGSSAPSGTASAGSGDGGSGGSSGGSTGTATDVLTYHNDTLRTGQNLTETVLTPSNVTVSSFGLLRVLPADGLVDAAPLIVSGLSIGGSSHNVVYVASEHDSVYSYDADSGAAIAQVSLLASGETPSDPVDGCTQVVPEIGVTSTPVIDRTAGSNGTLFVVAMSKDSSGNYHQRLHALDLTTLAERLSPVEITAAYSGSGPNSDRGQLTFNPMQYKERAALLLSQGVIYTAWASHCDDEPYNGWIMGYNETTLAQSVVFNLTANGDEGAIWGTGGLAADSTGAIYGVAGNGTFDTTLGVNGLPGQLDCGNCVFKLTASGGTLTLADYFTPYNTVTLSQTDTDFGSGSALLLPTQLDGSGTARALLVAAGKDGNLFVLNRNNLGHFDANTNAVYQEISDGAPGGVWSTFAYFNGNVYIGSVGNPLRAYSVSMAQLLTTPSSMSSINFAYPGPAPAISANGSSNGIVWAVEANSLGIAVLHAYNPANLAQEYYNSTQAANKRDGFGAGNKFMTPVIANGKVFVGTPTGVAVFGEL
jgi:hypothetical protein